ncbi:hypothetical protein FA95DRAFT_1376095 [Auriscalpium vulgare]|uniref:Uncharacterized protein n=1 Tax=Auriscalpium vulgare TaxID=40419 RepID=A0ACB8S7V9_9AGAM|nr:hypothetical protein FA95DRAFT_1376095 [Auriscalpium vulgare]
MNPNFPQNLSIQPSHRPQNPLLSATPSASDNSSVLPYDSDTVFSAQAQEDAITKYGIAGRVWEAAYLMLLYLNPAPAYEFSPPPFLLDYASPITAIELGAGTGIVGLALAERLAVLGRQGDGVVLTDLPEVCPLLEENSRLHGEKAAVRGAEVVVKPLAWGSQEHAEAMADGMRFGEHEGARPLTHIVCSDLVYFPELLAPLLRSLLHLTSPPFVPSQSPAASPPSTAHVYPSPEVILSYKTRSLAKETPFWSAFGLWFSYSPVLVRARGAPWARLGAADDAFVFVARRRPESMGWRVPAEDGALLGGAGARASEGHKSDDTFELLLLMGVYSD